MDIRALGMGVIFAIIWASAFSSARLIVADAPPFTALAIRFAISGAIGVGLGLALGQSWRLSPSQWRATILFGICQNALYLGLFFLAMQTIEASLAAIIASTMPLLVALGGWVFYRETLRPLGVAGLLAGTVGVVVIMGTRLSGGVDPTGLILCIIGTLSLTLATLSVRSTGSGGNVLMIVGLQMLVGAAVLAVVAAVMETWVVTWSWTLIIAFIYTTLVPGLVATWVWFLLVNRIGATRAATFHFLTPFFGVTIAAMVLGETLSLWDAIGVGIVMLGILAVQVSKAQAKPAHADVNTRLSK